MTRLDFSRRADLVERMDEPDGDPAKLEATLCRFEVTNTLFSRYRTLLRRFILDDMRRDPRREHRLTDLGAGGCDIARWLVRHSRKQGLRIRIRAIEKDARAATYARRASNGYPEIEVVQADALDPACWREPDYVYAQHFLHHLPDAACVQLVRDLARGVRRRFVINDLRRSRTAYHVFSLISRPLSVGTYITEDGLSSIRRSFSATEAQQLLERARPAGRVSTFNLFPARLVIVGGPA
jgi:hypothetical protein